MLFALRIISETGDSLLVFPHQSHLTVSQTFIMAIALRLVSEKGELASVGIYCRSRPC